MALDMKQRERLARNDDESTRRKIELAREIIYKKNFAVDTRAIEELLKDESLTPTLVSSEHVGIRPSVYLITAECICPETGPIWRKSL
jgi:hypothetical protein